MEDLFDALPALCVDLIADELADVSSNNFISSKAEGDLCYRERSIEDMFVDLCAIAATSRAVRAALGARMVARLHGAVRAEIASTTSLAVLRQYSTHPTRIKSRFKSEYQPFGSLPDPSDNDRKDAVDYLFGKKAPKVKCLSGLSKRLLAIVSARPWATRICAIRSHLVASCYGIDHVTLESAMPTLLTVGLNEGSYESVLRRRDLRAVMVSALGTTDLESARHLYASARARRAKAAALLLPPGCTAADSLLMNRFVSGRGEEPTLHSPPTANAPPPGNRRPPVKGWLPPSAPGGATQPGLSRIDLMTKKKVCVLCGEGVEGIRHPAIWGRWTRTCCACAPLCIDGERPTAVRGFFGPPETTVDRYTHGNIYTCAPCFVDDDKMARRRREVHMSCGCVFDAERVAEDDDHLFGL